MKKTLIVFLIISIFATIIPTHRAIASGQDSGLQLKNMGLLKGYADGSLKEDKLITNGEYLVLIARLARKVRTSEVNDLVTPKNGFDKFVNSVYRKYSSLKERIIDGYYNFLALLPNYEAIPGVGKSQWFFKSALYLKKIGFNFASDFDINAKATQIDMYNWLFEALGYGDASSAVQASGSINDLEKLQIVMVEHGLSYENFHPADHIKRGEVFNIILNILQK
ncbi:MAG: hypothetical protein ACPLZB_01730 [Caldisericaceae bacterium]